MQHNALALHAPALPAGFRVGTLEMHKVGGVEGANAVLILRQSARKLQLSLPGPAILCTAYCCTACPELSGCSWLLAATGQVLPPGMQGRLQSNKRVWEILGER